MRARVEFCKRGVEMAVASKSELGTVGLGTHFIPEITCTVHSVKTILQVLVVTKRVCSLFLFFSGLALILTVEV